MSVPGAASPLAQPHVVSSVLFYRKAITRATLSAALFALVVAMVLPDSWTARGTFVTPGTKAESLGSLAGLASQFGVNIPAGGSGYQPRFFASLVSSDQVLNAVAREPLRDLERGDGSPTSLADALRIRGSTPGIRIARTVIYLRRNVVSAIYDQRDGITTFSVTTKSAALSAAIAAGLVREVNKLTSERLRERGSAEREFVEGRRDAIGKELKDAEEALSSYLMRNRETQMLPEKRLEVDRLGRRVTELGAVYTSLSQAFEQARIEEVRNTPSLTIIDQPTAPELPDRRPIAQWIVAAAILAMAGATGFAVLGQRLGVLAVPGDVEPRDLKGWWPIIRHDLTRPWRLIF